MDFNIRNFQSDQAESLNKLAVSAFYEHKDHYSDWNGLSNSLGNMASLVDCSEIIVATLNEKLIGGVAYAPPGQQIWESFSKDWATLTSLVVDPQKRGLGVGKSLVSECIARAIRDEAFHLGLVTSNIMKIALPMYLRLDFVKHSDNIIDIHGVPYSTYIKQIKS